LCDYILIGDEDIFDGSVYNKGIQKMRSLYCCKDDRPDRPIRVISVKDFHQFLDQIPFSFNEEDRKYVTEKYRFAGSWRFRDKSRRML